MSNETTVGVVLSGSKVIHRTTYNQGADRLDDRCRHGSASLEVIERLNGTVSVVAYLPCDTPEVLHNGTLESARREWSRCLDWLQHHGFTRNMRD